MARTRGLGWVLGEEVMAAAVVQAGPRVTWVGSSQSDEGLDVHDLHVERRTEPGEACPPEEVRQRLLAPPEPLLGAHPPVARDHLDHRGRQVEPGVVLAAHAVPF